MSEEKPYCICESPIMQLIPVEGCMKCGKPMKPNQQKQYPEELNAYSPKAKWIKL